jgi:hypothetical protein
VGASSRQRIDVARRGHGWSVRYQDVEQGPYFSCELALAVAAIHARRASAAGMRPRIVVQARDGIVHAEWPTVTEGVLLTERKPARSGSAVANNTEVGQAARM